MVNFFWTKALSLDLAFGPGLSHSNFETRGQLLPTKFLAGIVRNTTLLLFCRFLNTRWHLLATKMGSSIQSVNNLDLINWFMGQKSYKKISTCQIIRGKYFAIKVKLREGVKKKINYLGGMEKINTIFSLIMTHLNPPSPEIYIDPTEHYFL